MSTTELSAPNSEAKVDSSMLILEESREQSSPTTRFLSVFGSTFATIFLAELGDKTQVATLLMTAQSHAPWIVFAGAASALIATSLMGVLIGRWLCQNLAPKTLEKATGCILLLVSVLLVLDVARM
jgi:putative Ca2+/H+ antiporter (TMEM165/GDT1 family)